MNNGIAQLSATAVDADVGKELVATPLENENHSQARALLGLFLQLKECIIKSSPHDPQRFLYECIYRVLLHNGYSQCEREDKKSGGVKYYFNTTKPE